MRGLVWWLGLSFYLFALSGVRSQAWGWMVVWWTLLGLWVLIGVYILGQRALRSTMLRQIGGLRGKKEGEGKAGT